jgi:hypothetical protein
MKTNKPIPKSHGCGFKTHKPIITTYNDFLDNLIIGEFVHTELTIDVSNGDLCIFIFDTFEDILEVEVKNIHFVNQTPNIENTMLDPTDYGHNIFVICGGARTFLNCIDSYIENVVTPLFNTKNNIYLLFYLKLDDPGPKGQINWNYTYDKLDYNTVLNKVNSFKNIFKVYHKIIETDEISNIDLLHQIKDRSKYTLFFDDDKKLLRAMHCHYNLEKCGELILNIEREQNINFNYIICSRPDLFFKIKSKHISSYRKDTITSGHGPLCPCQDHHALIPRSFLDDFFFKRMQVYRTNTNREFDNAESIYFHTIHFIIDELGLYYIKRS